MFNPQTDFGKKEGEKLALSVIASGGAFIAYLPLDSEGYFPQHKCLGFHGIILEKLEKAEQLYVKRNPLLKTPKVICEAKGDGFSGVIVENSNHEEFFLQLQGDAKLRENYVRGLPFDSKLNDGWSERVERGESILPPAWTKDFNPNLRLFIISREGTPVFSLADINRRFKNIEIKEQKLIKGGELSVE